MIVLSSNPDEVFTSHDNKQTSIRIGDINNDSYPDIITVIQSLTTNSSTARIYINVPSSSRNTRTFNSSIETNKITQSNVAYASFFDLDENGQLDVNIVTKDNNKYNVIGYYNNYIYDAFFLKSTTLQTKDKFSTSEIGTNYRYIVTNLDGSRRMDVSFQASQNGATSLTLPYSFVGIGRSNNYVENFHVISNTYISQQQDAYKIYTPIIPNSQLLISKEFKDNTL